MGQSLNSHIDWLGFTVDVRDGFGDTPDDTSIKESFHARFGELLGDDVAEKVLDGDDWEPASGRRPYRRGYACKPRGVFVFYGGHPHATVEFSGRGCEWLRSNELLKPVLMGASDRMTRIDVAVDIETATRPKEFVSSGYSARIKTRNDRVSESGETVTLGSWKSDRFCNIYRYNAPHPRSHLLRIEWRLKSDYARNAALYLQAYGAGHLAGMLDQSYKFKSKEWNVKYVKESLPGKPSNKNSASTLRWVLKQVAPAIKNLIRMGVIENPEEFFEEHFIPENKQEKML